MVFSDAAIAFTDLNVELEQIDKNKIENFDLIPLFQIECIIALDDTLSETENEIPLPRVSETNEAKLKNQDSITGNQTLQPILKISSIKKQTSLKLSTSEVKNAIKISTAEDGYNSGREYLLQTESADRCIKMSKELERLSKAARDRFAFNSKWNRVQEKMRIVYSSNLVQGFVGTLIILVSPFSIGTSIDLERALTVL
jgi:hypothetical protein